MKSVKIYTTSQCQEAPAMPEQQVRSKSRVAAHGEVFTAQREVKAMCDLVKTETERIESRFLEIILAYLIQRAGIIKKCAFAV